MEEHNRDMFPTQETIDLYAEISELVANPVVDSAFQAFETKATAAKARYHRLGGAAIWLIAIATIYTVAEALVLPNDAYLDAMSIIAAALAFIGVALQAYLLADRTKESWLVNRFGAERCRAIKFQAYSLAMNGSERSALHQRVEAYSNRQIVDLHNELNAGIAAVTYFDPVASLSIAPIAEVAESVQKEQALEAYSTLRHAYQRRFATAELQAHKDRERIAHSSSDMIYLIGAVLVLVALVSKVFELGLGTYTGWIDFLAVGFFVVSLSKEIVSNSRLTEESLGRFSKYLRDLQNADKLHASRGDLESFITETELAAMRELDAFCRAAGRISFRI